MAHVVLALLLVLFAGVVSVVPATAQQQKPLAISGGSIHTEDGVSYVDAAILTKELGIATKQLEHHLVLCTADLCVRVSKKTDCHIDGEKIFVSVPALEESLGLSMQRTDDGFLASLAHASSEQPAVGAVRQGQVFPDFSLPALKDGKPIRLSDYRGKRVLLVCWASW